MKIDTFHVGSGANLPAEAEVDNFFEQWQEDLHKAYENAVKEKGNKDLLILLIEIKEGVADMIIYDRKAFIDWLNAGVTAPPGMVDMISSPANVLHKVEPGEAFWVVATTVNGYIGCFDMVKTDIHFNSSGSNQSN